MKLSRARFVVVAGAVIMIAGLIAVAAIGPRLVAALGFRGVMEPDFAPVDANLRPAAPPADCLLVAEAADIESFCSRLGEILGAFDEGGAPEELRRAFGRLIGNREFTGVSLEEPVRFYLMDPKKYAQPWVFQFDVSDADAAQAAMAGGDSASEPFFCVENGLATRAFSSRAGEAVVQWRRGNGGAIEYGVSGQLCILLDVERIMATYEEEIAAGIPAMKERMSEAMERVGNREAASRDAGSARKELDAIMSLLRQIDVVSIAVAMKASRVEAAVDVKPLAGATLAGVARSHRAAAADLLNLCPPDAAVVIAQNLSAMDALKRLVGQVLGIREIGFLTRADSGDSGQVLAALFMPAGDDDYAGVLELREGARAADAEDRWKELAASPGTGDDRPMRIVPVEIANADETSVRLADVVLNERVLGEGGANMIRNVFGPAPKVALGRSRQGTIFCLGPSPLARLGEVLSLAEGGGASLAFEPAFSDVMAAAGCVPNLLVYAAPAGVRGWLWLAGLDPGPVHADEEALAGWVSFGRDGMIHARLRAPTAALRRALFNDGQGQMDSGLARSPIPGEPDSRPGGRLRMHAPASSPPPVEDASPDGETE